MCVLTLSIVTMLHSADKKSVVFAIIVIAALSFVPFLGNTMLFDWDEINFAEGAREMIASGDWFRVRINYEPFWEKPPLFIWLQALSMSVFGIGEFAARLPNALIGIVTLVLLFLAGESIGGRRMGIWWTLMYWGSLLPHFYFRSALIDPLFNLFMAASAFFIARGALSDLPSKRSVALAGVLCGLAVLTKGPVGLLLPALAWLAAALAMRKNILAQLPLVGLFLLCTAGVAVAWFGAYVAQFGWWFVEEFVRYQVRLLSTGDAGHDGPWFYHFVVVLIGCFPASLFAFMATQREVRSSAPKEMSIMMLSLLAVVMVVFAIVKTKILHYSSLSYFPVTYFAALAVVNSPGLQNRSRRLMGSVLAVFVVALTAGLMAVPLIGMNADALIPHIKDRFTAALLTAPVQWTGTELLAAAVFFALCVAGVFLIFKREVAHAAAFLNGGVAAAVFLFLPLVAPKIATILQGTPVSFYQSLAGRDVYVKVLGYKSYAHHFYSMQQPEQAPSSVGLHTEGEWEEYLLNGPIAKPAFFVAKTHDAARWFAYPGLMHLADSCGYSFFMRRPPGESIGRQPEYLSGAKNAETTPQEPQDRK